MGDNEDALEKTIVALEGLTDEHAALIEQARTLARTLDVGDADDSKLHGEYRQVLKMLMELGKKQEVDAFVEALKKLALKDD